LSYKNICAALLCLMSTTAATDTAAETYPESPLHPVQLRQRALQRCYEDQLKRLPTAQGSVELTFIVKPGGRIRQISVTRDTVIPEEAAAQRAEFEACITAALSTIILNYHGEEDVTLTQRLRFAP
jgi:hypothetical protein